MRGRVELEEFEFAETGAGVALADVDAVPAAGVTAGAVEVTGAAVTVPEEAPDPDPPPDPDPDPPPDPDPDPVPEPDELVPEPWCVDGVW